MLNLIRNENMKIYRRPRTWIMLGIVLGLYAFVVLMMFFFTNELSDYDWRERYERDRQYLSQDIDNVPPAAREQLQHELMKIEYALEHDIPPVNATMWGGVLDSTGFIMLVTIMTVIVAGDIVASEFTWGTIKMLLIRPASRAKILLSKYLASFLYALFLLVALLVFSIALNGVLYGFSGFGQPLLIINGAGDGVKEVSLFGHVLKAYALSTVELIMIVTMAFMISSVFRSSALAIAFSIVALLMGYLVTINLAMFFDWAKYLLFANTDLTQHLENRPIVEGMTMGFSITMLALYFIVFNLLSWLVFTKRDVAS
ncbi:ABC transporter permease [Xylanibacillus composti]|uniref:ABC-2 type transport system permease protein n=1 Tax=Xylanibacillus composti TaxID=1572762 RepID=A0A8J4H3Z6_9BACL|nr:ABC transporter permease [Xylanibacillus composti]MDT9725826.1 ABC transporter permease [Xylanibacillus composti]GIQ69220.1 hypothetical protein XYCOK13_20440 [Xylanibacillus composti]